MTILPIITELNFLLEKTQNQSYHETIDKIRNCCIINLDYIELKFYIEIFIDFLITINNLEKSCETMLQILMLDDFNGLIDKIKEIEKINKDNQNLKLILNDQSKSFQFIFEIFDYIYVNKDTIQNDNHILNLIPGFKIEMLIGNGNDIFISKGVETKIDIDFDSLFFKTYYDSQFYIETYSKLEIFCNGNDFKIENILNCIVNIYLEITLLYKNTNIIFYSIEYEKYENFKAVFETIFNKIGCNKCDEFYLTDNFLYFRTFTCLFQILSDETFNTLLSLAVINAKNIIINEKRSLLNNTLTSKINELNDNKKFIFYN